MSNKAPWKDLLLEQLVAPGHHPVSICLATVTHDGRPRVRDMAPAGFWSIRYEIGSKVGWESDCPVFQTTASLNKVADILGVDYDNGNSGSAGARQVEAVY